MYILLTFNELVLCNKFYKNVSHFEGMLGAFFHVTICKAGSHYRIGFLNSFFNLVISFVYYVVMLTRSSFTLLSSHISVLYIMAIHTKNNQIPAEMAY